MTLLWILTSPDFIKGCPNYNMESWLILTLLMAVVALAEYFLESMMLTDGLLCDLSKSKVSLFSRGLEPLQL